jgi:hypothetical protein
MWYFDILHFAVSFGLLNVISINIVKTLFKNTSILDEKEYLLVKVGEKCASTVHSIIVVYLAHRILVDNYIWAHRISYITKESILLSHITCGYFLYDVVYCTIRYKYVGAIFWGHAALAFGINLISILSGVGHFYTAAFVVWETSTPFVNTRYFMNKLKVSMFKNGIDLMIMLTFLIFRIIWGTFIFYIIVLDTIYASEGILLKIPVFIAFFMNALNYFWFSKMLHIIMHKYLE